MKWELFLGVLIIGLFNLSQVYSSQAIQDSDVDSKATYAALFQADDRQLLYIANTHEAARDSATFQWIGLAFTYFKPDLVILEGIETNLGNSPALIRKQLQTMNSPDPAGEILYAAHLALENRIDFLGGEPNYEEVYNHLKDEGFTHRDLIFFYFTRQLPQYDEDQPVKSQTDIRCLFQRFIIKYDNASQYTFDQYQLWLNEKLSEQPALNELVNSELTAPLVRGNYLQKMSYKIGIIRDKNVVQTVLTALKTKKNILVIYGKSHFPLQKSSLEKELGSPKYFTNAQSFIGYFQKTKEQMLNNPPTAEQVQELNTPEKLLQYVEQMKAELAE